MKFLQELFLRTQDFLSTLLTSIQRKKALRITVISSSLLFLLLLALCSNANSDKEERATPPFTHTEIAATIYAEMYLHTEIAATIFAQITPVPSITPQPTSDQFASILDKYSCYAPDLRRVEGKVQKVILVDEIEVSINGESTIVHYQGINTPSSSLTEQMRLSAIMKNQELTLGQDIVILTDDSLEPDDNLLGYVFTKEYFVNAEMVKEGFSTVNLNTSDLCTTYLLDSENNARNSRVGIWSIPTSTPTLKPTSIKIMPTSTKASAMNCHPSYPDVCIPYPPPDLDCPDIPFRRFRVFPPDPHGFDGDNDGIGCER